MAKIHRKYLERSIKRLEEEAHRRQMPISRKDILELAREKGFLKGTHKLKLTPKDKQAPFKIVRLKKQNEESPQPKRTKNRNTVRNTAKVITSVRLSQDHLIKIQKHCEQSDTTRTDIIEQALDLYFNQKGDV